MNNEKLYAVRIRPDGTVEIVETLGGADGIHELVGGYFENVYFSDFLVSNVIMVVDESAKLTGKPVNMIASCIYGNVFDVIVGDAILLKLVRVGELEELDEVPFPYDEAEIVRRIVEMYREHPRQAYYKRLKEYYENPF